MYQTEFAVGEAIRLIGVGGLIKSAGFGDFYPFWASIWPDVSNDIINLHDPHLQELGEGSVNPPSQ
eukprot:11494571-Ditylum_brightwellii.AAC.1